MPGAELHKEVVVGEAEAVDPGEEAPGDEYQADEHVGGGQQRYACHATQVTHPLDVAVCPKIFAGLQTS